MTTSFSRALKPWASRGQLAQRTADEQVYDLSSLGQPNGPLLHATSKLVVD